MYLTGHAAIGITLAAAVGAEHPALAFGVGWISHYIADFFPHGDEPAGEWAKRGNEVKRLFALLMVDGAIFLCAFALFSARQGFVPAAAAAAIGSFVPDILWGFEKLIKRKFTGPLEKFHTWNHNFFHVRLSLWAGLAGQVLLAGGLWAWLTFR